MTTARQLIEDAFDDIEVKTSEEPLTTADLNTGIRRLNRLGTAFAASGLNFGFSKVVNADEVLTIPDWAEDLFVTFLAIRLAPGYGVLVNAALVAAATEMLTTAEHYLIQLPSVAFPEILPTGAGNEVYNDAKFFFTDDDSDLTTNGLSALTDNTSVTLSTD
jgi:hypothetical protein